jgi:hypothetical protein
VPGTELYLSAAPLYTTPTLGLAENFSTAFHEKPTTLQFLILRYRQTDRQTDRQTPAFLLHTISSVCEELTDRTAGFLPRKQQILHEKKYFID